ncbi:hypothetical protein SCHPADRAFT_325306 [Schizopora paradoxa]|uniref:Uncharacterized protein n=1 Tax=Schizopora paradoxa TaxID=27342 RepID=A0A0H2RQD3_9AGAM|nr:hypothetical protein SCHPADRAFT_325306 [Schizopora paradoxa]
MLSLDFLSFIILVLIFIYGDFIASLSVESRDQARKHTECFTSSVLSRCLPTSRACEVLFMITVISSPFRSYGWGHVVVTQATGSRTKGLSSIKDRFRLNPSLFPPPFRWISP